MEGAACGSRAKPRQHELHHVDYGSISYRNGRWIAGEQHEDLMPLHPYCHELIDRDTVLQSTPIDEAHRHPPSLDSGSASRREAPTDRALRLLHAATSRRPLAADTSTS